MSERQIREFEIISEYFSSIGCWPSQDSATRSAIEVGDDCAVVSIPQGFQLCFSLDTLVCGTHFPPSISPERLATRALTTALSDLAAMGAIPWCFTLALTLPNAIKNWIERFSRSLNETAIRYAIRLVGGDTTCGPLAISIQVQGLLPKGQGLFRHHAKAGDLVCVTGCLGDAAGALSYLDIESEIMDDSPVKRLLNKYYQPEPRLVLGQKMLSYARCGIDISDGLLADFNHIAQLSGVGGVIYPHKIPVSQALVSLFPVQALDLAMNGGDDYELIICLSPSEFERSACEALICIGEVIEPSGIFLENEAGHRTLAPVDGYQHFLKRGLPSHEIT